MAKDTRGLPGNEPVKKDLAAKTEASDAKIAKVAKDSTPEQVTESNKERLGELGPGSFTPKNPNIEPLDTSSSVFAPKGSDPFEVAKKLGKRKSRGKRVLNPRTPTQTTPTPGKEKKTAARSVGTAVPKSTTTLDFGKLPSRPASGVSQSATDNADVVSIN